MPDLEANLTLIGQLKRFNAKERFWLACQALDRYQPSPKFVAHVATAAGVPPPGEGVEVFMATDYHLNWLHAALTSNAVDFIYKNSCDLKDEEHWFALVENSQQDIDLLLAYETSGGSTQLLLVEAKCDSKFSATQMKPKLRRLSKILGSARNEGARFTARLVLMSPRENDTTYCESLVDCCGEYKELFPAKDPLTPTQTGWLRLESGYPVVGGQVKPDLWLVDFLDNQGPQSAKSSKVYWAKWRIRPRNGPKVAKGSKE